MTVMTEYPTFIDLRAFADAAMPGADPFGADRHILPLREGPVEVGAIALKGGAGEVPAGRGDVWMIAAEGSVALEWNGGSVVLSGDQSCLVPGGTAFSWRVENPAKLIFMRYSPGEGSPQGVVPVDLSAELAPSNPPLAEMLVGETPSCRNHTDFRSADGEFSCGVWDSTPYFRRPQRYVHFELMVLLEGSVTFVDEREAARTFRKGDIFLVEQGATCSWDSREHVTKIWAIYRPLA